ncbi:MAG TPA: hypothetical protein VE199_04100, partial [Nitrososphaera sp.]|nr:hypothetical protein [Nitrososphaera sp.]
TIIISTQFPAPIEATIVVSGNPLPYSWHGVWSTVCLKALICRDGIIITYPLNFQEIVAICYYFVQVTILKVKI